MSRVSTIGLSHFQRDNDEPFPAKPEEPKPGVAPMKVPVMLALVLLLLLTSACQAADVCPERSVTYVDDPTLFHTQALPASTDLTPEPSLVKIAGKEQVVDRVITGPVCDDVWSGKIYVACNIRLVQWKNGGKPNFFKNCNLKIEPATVVYVAAHNDAAYYNGCSCHTGGELK
jgi:hypothetical protein